MLHTKLGNITLGSPLVLASGILGTNETILTRVGKTSIGAITTKSIGPIERFGNKNPTVVEWEHGFINAVGLPSPGIENCTDELKALSEFKKSSTTRIIVSCYGHSVEQFVYVARKIAEHKPDMIELDLSCPNVSGGLMFSSDKRLAAEVVSSVKKVVGNIPVSAKLGPVVTDLVEIAKAVESAGADAITAINTMKGMVIDIDARKPILAFKTGGLSGPAIRPIAVRCVYEIYSAVKIPIIGTGGVSTGRDAIEMLMAGASAIGVGTATYYHGIEVFDKINNEIREWMKDNGVKEIKEIIGAAHK